jgi:hypothetical protein
MFLCFSCSCVLDPDEKPTSSTSPTAAYYRARLPAAGFGEEGAGEAPGPAQRERGRRCSQRGGSEGRPPHPVRRAKGWPLRQPEEGKELRDRVLPRASYKRGYFGHFLSLTVSYVTEVTEVAQRSRKKLNLWYGRHQNFSGDVPGWEEDIQAY